MQKEAVVTNQAPAPIGPYSQAIKLGNLVFVAGQGPSEPATRKIVEGGIEAQTRQVLENLKAILAAAGTSLDNAVKTTCFLQDLELTQQLGDHASQSRTLNNLAIVYRYMGRLDEARQCYENSLTLKRDLGDRPGELTTLINLCLVLKTNKEPETLRHYLQEASALAQALHDDERLVQIEEMALAAA